MASQTDDPLRNLPPELRQCVYSYLFFSGRGGDNRRILIGQTPQFDHSTLPVLKLAQDPFYLSWRRQRSLRSSNPKWVDDVDDALFQGQLR